MTYPPLFIRNVFGCPLVSQMNWDYLLPSKEGKKEGRDEGKNWKMTNWTYIKYRRFEWPISSEQTSSIYKLTVAKKWSVYKKREPREKIWDLVKVANLVILYKILTGLDAIQSEDSHFVIWFVHMMAGTNGLVAWSLLKGELGIKEDRKRPVRETENEN